MKNGWVGLHIHTHSHMCMPCFLDEPSLSLYMFYCYYSVLSYSAHHNRVASVLFESEVFQENGVGSLLPFSMYL